MRILSLGNFPFDVESNWSEECQGLTHDQHFWYIAQKGHLWRRVLEAPLNQNFPSADGRGIPGPLAQQFYNHIGDIDHHQGRLFAPLENNPPLGLIDKLPARVAVFTAPGLSFVGSAELASQGTAGPWCAVNPADGVLYSSLFGKAAELFRYEVTIAGSAVSLAPQPSLALIDQDGSPLTLRNVQGGAFTSDGALLFLACDATDGAGNRKGFAVIDTATGKRIAHQRAFANPIMEGWEVEGIDAWDFRDPRDGKVNVLVGLLLLNNDWPSSDNITLRTFRVIVDEPAGPGQPTGCETLRQRYELLKADLAQTDDVNEAKLIRAAMDQIVRQMKQQGCANLP